MSAPAANLTRDDDSPVGDQFVTLRASWTDYLRILKMRGDHSAPRITYHEGVVEIMSPSDTHEAIKSTIGCLVEAYCLHTGRDFKTVGSWTLKDKAKQAGAEPDECWIFTEGPASRPHLAIEVIWTSGGLDKLEVYRKLGVAEVWVWRKGRISAWILRGDEYVQAPRSEALPGIDLVELASFVDRPMTSQSVREYTAALEARAAL
ncbi:MAG: hypothetical protein AMXMBFR64_56150 [Myxococcales bacterium]